jgi:hypothetical protein
MVRKTTPLDVSFSSTKTAKFQLALTNHRFLLCHFEHGRLDNTSSRLLCFLGFETEKSGRVARNVQELANLRGSTVVPQGRREHHQVTGNRIDLAGCRTVSPHCRHPL